MPHNKDHEREDIRHQGSLCLLGSICLSAGINYHSDTNNYEAAAYCIDPKFRFESEVVYDFNDGLPPEDGAGIATAVLRRLADGLPWEQAIDTDVEYPVAS